MVVVFNTLMNKKLFANGKKCVFGHLRIQYFGLWISSKWVEAKGEKIKAMANWVGAERCDRTYGIFWVDKILQNVC